MSKVHNEGEEDEEWGLIREGVTLYRSLNEAGEDEGPSV